MTGLLYFLGYVISTRALAYTIFAIIYGYDELWKEEIGRDDFGRPTASPPIALWLFLFAEFIGTFWFIVSLVVAPAKVAGAVRTKAIEFYTMKTGKFSKEQGQLSEVKNG